MKKYRTGGYDRWLVEAKIEEVEAERETETSIWIKGRRNNKLSGYEAYHDTWEAAHNFLMEKATEKVESARRELERHKSALGNVKGMRKP